MPHFIVHCSQDIINTHSIPEINKAISQRASDSGLFDPADIKARVDAYDHYLVGGQDTSFVHVFAHIMEGRSEIQRAELSRSIVTLLSDMFPEVNNIAMNIYQFEKATYCNRVMLNTK